MGDDNFSDDEGAWKISWEKSVALISESVVVSKVDLSSSYLYRLSHPTHGDIVVVSSSCEGSGVVRV
jgi:hypothetical protein